MSQTNIKSGEDVTHLFNTSDFKSGDDVTHLMQPDDNEQSIVSNNRGTIPAASTWTGGFLRSMLNREALNKGLEGARGFIKGGTIDIPSTFINSIESTLNSIKDKYNNKGLDLNTPATGIDFTNAGSDAESFGRSMGQLTGQPLTTYGLVKISPSIIRGTGIAAEGAGNIMRRHTPISGMPGGFLLGRNARKLEQLAGKALAYAGKKMQNVGSDGIREGEIVNEVPLPTQEGNFTVKPSNQKLLNKSKVSFYSPEKNPTVMPPEFFEKIIPGFKQKQLPPSNTSFYLDEGNNLPSTILPKAGSMPDLGPIEFQPNIIIKQPTLTNVAQAVRDGYKFTHQNKDGSYNFQFVGKFNKSK